MEKLKLNIVQSNLGKSLLFLTLALMYLFTFETGLICNDYSNELEFRNFAQIQQVSLSTVSNSIDSHKISNPREESPIEKFIAFETDANEEEVDSYEECDIDNYNHIQSPESLSQILHIYSNQLSKRKQIPLFILHSSWKSFIIS